MYPDLEENILMLIDKLQLRHFLRLDSSTFDVISIVKLLNSDKVVVVLPISYTEIISSRLKAELQNIKLILFNSTKLKPNEVVIAF